MIEDWVAAYEDRKYRPQTGTWPDGATANGWYPVDGDLGDVHQGTHGSTCEKYNVLIPRKLIEDGPQALTIMSEDPENQKQFWTDGTGHRGAGETAKNKYRGDGPGKIAKRPEKI